MKTLQKLEVLDCSFACVVGREPRKGEEVKEEVAEASNLALLLLRRWVDIQQGQDFEGINNAHHEARLRRWLQVPQMD